METDLEQCMPHEWKLLDNHLAYFSFSHFQLCNPVPLLLHTIKHRIINLLVFFAATEHSRVWQPRARLSLKSSNVPVFNSRARWGAEAPRPAPFARRSPAFPHPRPAARGRQRGRAHLPAPPRPDAGAAPRRACAARPRRSAEGTRRRRPLLSRGWAGTCGGAARPRPQPRLRQWERGVAARAMAPRWCRCTCSPTRLREPVPRRAEQASPGALPLAGAPCPGAGWLWRLRDSARENVGTGDGPGRAAVPVCGGRASPDPSGLAGARKGQSAAGMRLSPSPAAVEGKTGQKYFSGITPGSAGSTCSWDGSGGGQRAMASPGPVGRSSCRAPQVAPVRGPRGRAARRRWPRRAQQGCEEKPS